ncbi:MAG: DUF1223 domain-containing protein [Casimicrobiaceae bacterium]
MIRLTHMQDVLSIRFVNRGVTVLALGLIVTATASGAAAQSACTATSGAQLRPLVELFTSEGCSSCPPADRWLTAEFPAERLDAGVTALAFHVDYWDRLGWKDRFASAQFTQRQYEAMRANRATFVYTPQVLVQGRDAQEWKRGAVTSLAAAGKRPARASVTLDATHEGGAYKVRASASVADAALRANAVLWLAYADSGLVSNVQAGENRGVRLAHDHVVRSLHGPFAVNAKGEAAASVAIATPAERGRTPVLVAFVQDTKNGDVLQTLTLLACGET